MAFPGIPWQTIGYQHFHTWQIFRAKLRGCHGRFVALGTYARECIWYPLGHCKEELRVGLKKEDIPVCQRKVKKEDLTVRRLYG